MRTKKSEEKMDDRCQVVCQKTCKNVFMCTSGGAPLSVKNSNINFKNPLKT